MTRDIVESYEHGTKEMGKITIEIPGQGKIVAAQALVLTSGSTYYDEEGNVVKETPITGVAATVFGPFKAADLISMRHYAEQVTDELLERYKVSRKEGDNGDEDK